jgi:hypothetical protein
MLAAGRLNPSRALGFGGVFQLVKGFLGRFSKNFLEEWNWGADGFLLLLQAHKGPLDRPPSTSEAHLCRLIVGSVEVTKMLMDRNVAGEST